MKKKIYIYYLAGYPVSGKNIGRISGQISIRYNPKLIVISSVHFFLFYKFPNLWGPMDICTKLYVLIWSRNWDARDRMKYAPNPQALDGTKKLMFSRVKRYKIMWSLEFVHKKQWKDKIKNSRSEKRGVAPAVKAGSEYSIHCSKCSAPLGR